MDALVSKGRLSLEGNISLLQEHIRRDPDSYRAEFLDRHRHFLQLMRLLVLQSAGDQHVGQQRALAQSVVELTNFLASVAFCYPGFFLLFI
jgi:hypothetical protein